MATTTVYEVTCSGCDEETTVVETVMHATRFAPAEGETSPEECPKCGKHFDDDDDWQEGEPPEPDHHRDDW